MRHIPYDILGESVDVAPGENIDVNVKICWCDDE